MLPNFICVGPGRAGTTWLYEVLREHPQVCMAKNIKETMFFDSNYSKGIGWYEKFFEDCAGSPALGEITNHYYRTPEVSLRIKNAIPDCKILICLRNPYERIQSVYSFKIREGALSCSFEEALEKMPELIADNRYYTLVKPYYDLFGKDNIFIQFYDDLVNQPARLCADLFAFLGVATDFSPSVLNKKVNSAVVPRFPFVGLLAKGLARTMRRMHLHAPLTWAKRSEGLYGIFFKEYSYKGSLMTEKARLMIDPVVLPELEMLERLVNRKLNDWRKS